MDYNLLKNDINNRYTVTSLIETVEGDGYIITVVIGGVSTVNSWRMSLFNAYETLRYNLLNTTQPCLPMSTTTQRNALSDLEVGLQIYNTTSNSVETYNGSTWV